jgi:hypothetical protein
MSIIQVEVRDGVYNAAMELARIRGIPVERLIAAAVEEAVYRALEEDGYVQRRAARSSREAFERVLALVPHAPPDPGDEIDDDSESRR